MSDWFKVALLSIACVPPATSIYDYVSNRSARQWQCTWEELKRDGFRRLGPFEEPIPSIRLSDPTTFHMSCGPGCTARKGATR